jgi:hypothetical protein
MVVTILVAVATALIAAAFQSEYQAWMPWIAERLRKLALVQLPTSLRPRYDEEWASYLEEVPGFVGKVAGAFGLIVASVRMSADEFVRRMLWNLAGDAMSTSIKMLLVYSRVAKIARHVIRNDRGFLLRVAIAIFMIHVRIYVGRLSLISNEDLRKELQAKAMAEVMTIPRVFEDRLKAQAAGTEPTLTQVPFSIVKMPELD